MKPKNFLNIDQLIETILNKGIKINNIENTKNILKQNNYYVIMGYKHLFLDDNKNYRRDVSFENDLIYIYLIKTYDLYY